MRDIKNSYLLYVLILCIVGGVFAYLSSEAGFVTQQITTMDTSGNKNIITVLKPATNSWVLSVVSTFIFSMAISIFISVFVIKKIDIMISKEKEDDLKAIQKAINVDVFDSLFKTLVPAEIFEVFKSDVISNKIVRKNANWIYDFRETGKDEEIELVQTIKYELHNVSHESVQDAISASFDGHGVGNGVRKAVCMFEGQELAVFDVEKMQTNASGEETINTSIDGKVTVTRYPNGHSKLVINVEIPPNKKIDVTMVHFTLYDHFFVNDGYFTKYPMINASLTATYPESYDFEIFQALSSELKQTLKQKNRTIFEVEGGILPHQGFVYTLKRKPELNILETA